MAEDSSYSHLAEAEEASWRGPKSSLAAVVVLEWEILPRGRPLAVGLLTIGAKPERLVDVGCIVEWGGQQEQGRTKGLDCGEGERHHTEDRFSTTEGKMG